MVDDELPPTPMVQKGAIPTNTVTYKGRRIPARIDPEARVAYIVEIMAASFTTKENHITLCLRDEEDTLVTQNNLPSKVYNHDVLKLSPSPATEALVVVTSLKASLHKDTVDGSTVDTLAAADTVPLKLALFNLQKYIKEEEFAVEFLLRGGMRMLVRLLEKEDGGLAGNSLAYALQGVRGILEFESGWGGLSDTFIDRVITLVIHASQPNILRPATAVIRKLVISSPQLSGESTGLRMTGNAYVRMRKDRKGKGRGKEGKNKEGEVNQYGFERVYGRMKGLGIVDAGEHGVQAAEYVFKILVKRLEGTGDLELVAQSLGLINACLRSGHQEGSRQYHELVWILEHLNIRRYISRLIPTSSGNVVEPHILNFQARLATILQYRRLYPVRPTHHRHQDKLLQEIWEAGRLGHLAEYEGTEGQSEVLRHGPGMGEADASEQRSVEGWSRIGLGVGDEVGVVSETDLFRDVGELGLECLHWFATHEERFFGLVMEQQARPPGRRCPIGKASAECVKILCEHYKISQGGHNVPNIFQLFLLNFSRLHQLVLKFFLRMWQESESQLSDFDRVSFLVRSQLRISLTDEGSKTWLHLERDFLETEYRTIRDRQMDLLDKEDGVMQRAAVMMLKEKVGKEVYDVISEQRIGCMLQGSWFNSASVIVPGLTSVANTVPGKPLRFLRLSSSRQTIAWDDFSQRTESPAYGTLRHRIDISNVASVRSQTGCAVNSRSPTLVSKLSFSIISREGSSLLDLDAIHAAQLAEWSDGIKVLLGNGGMESQDSANFVHILTELALNVRLLDITGDGVEIPEMVPIGPAPKSRDFVFAK